MKKTNTAIKRRKFIRKIIRDFILGQIIILIVGGQSVYHLRQIKPDDCIVQKIMVEKCTFVTKVKGPSYVRIYSNGVQYRFPSMGWEDKYSNHELAQKIKPGQILEIKYINTRHFLFFFVKDNLIVEAGDGSDMYLDLDSYNSQLHSSFVALLVVLPISELVFLAILILRVLFNAAELKLFPNRKKKKRAKPPIID